MTISDYDTAYQAASVALEPIKGRAIRDILAENVAACVIGKGSWGAERWTALATSDERRQLVVRAAMRDMPGHVVASSGPVDAAVIAAAQALLNKVS